MNHANVMLMALPCALALSACNTPTDLMRWHEETGVPDKPQQPHLWVTTQSADSPAPLTAKGLPDHAAAAYVKEIAASFGPKKPDDFRAYLAKAIAKPDSAVSDQTKLNRVMTVILDRQTIRPGDRYLMTRIEVMPSSSKVRDTPYWAHDFEFVDYQLASSDTSSINIGNVSFSHEVATSFTLSPAINGASSPSATLGPTITNTQSGTRIINDRAQMGVSVIPTRVVINRTGAEGTDLTGNVLVKVGLQFDEHTVERVYYAEADISGEDGALKQPAAADIKITSVNRPISTPYYLCAHVTYVERVIDKGNNHWDEGKQDVTMHNGELPWDAYPVTASDEISKPTWDVVHDGDDGSDIALKLKSTLQSVPISFSDRDEAAQFLEWLQAQKPGAMIGKKKLTLGMGSRKDAGDFRSLTDASHLKILRRPGVQPYDRDEARSHCKIYGPHSEMSTAMPMSKD